MEGNIFRVTYNNVKNILTIYMKDGTEKIISMSEDEWKDMIKGNVIENINKILNE